jgi:hypothetical protein
VGDFLDKPFPFSLYTFNSSQSEFLFILKERPEEGMTAFVEKRKPTYVGE